MNQMPSRTVAHEPSERLLFGIPDVGVGIPAALSPAAATRPERRATSSAPVRLREIAAAAVDRVGRDLEAERARGGLFLLCPVLFGAGAVVYFLMPGEPGLAVLGGLLASAGIATLLAGGVFRLLALAFCLAIAGASAGKIETVRAGTQMLGSEISTVMTGEVERIERLANGRFRLTIEIRSTARPELRYAPQRVRVTARSLPEGVAPGSVVEGIVRLFPPSGPVRPDGYDFAFESFFAGRGATGFFLRGPSLSNVVAELSAGETATVAVEQFRDRLASRIRATVGGPEGEIAAALIAGIRGGIPEEANEALRITGLAHVLSISGLHMALVAATVMVTFRAGFALFPGFASRHPVKKYAAGLALLVAALYLLASGAEVAALRSFLMLAIMLVALLFDQAAITMRNLAIAALIILAVSPHEVMGPSFQMSFAATAALIAFYAGWMDWRARRPHPDNTARTPARRTLSTIMRYVAGLAATSLIAGLATTLYGVWHFQRVSPLSLAANLAAMPIVSVLVMPFAVIAMAAMPFGLDGPFLRVMGQGIDWMLDIARWFAKHTPLDAVGQIPISTLVLFTGALLIATLSVSRLRLAALPLAFAGLIALAGRGAPDAYVSEDARLLAMRIDADRMAVNRNRPNRFSLDTWMRAAATRQTVAPDRAPDGFGCEGGLCIADPGDGRAIAHASTAGDAIRACKSVRVVIVDDATAARLCDSGEATVITARDLARRGSAEIRFQPGTGRPLVRHAIAEPFRPWHQHRGFSRAARGLAPWKREDQPPTTDAQPPAGGQ